MPLLLPICSKSADWTFVDHKKDFDMTEKANSPRAPLKSGLPHVGYVLLWHPLLPNRLFSGKLRGCKMNCLWKYTLYMARICVAAPTK